MAGVRAPDVGLIAECEVNSCEEPGEDGEPERNASQPVTVMRRAPAAMSVARGLARSCPQLNGILASPVAWVKVVRLGTRPSISVRSESV
jgi:hypothetical protein